jgi:hypothetical protein
VRTPSKIAVVRKRQIIKKALSKGVAKNIFSESAFIVADALTP